MRKAIFIVIGLMVVLNIYAEDIIVTNGNDSIVLHDDYTWEYLSEEESTDTKQKGEKIILNREKNFDSLVKNKNKNYSDYIDKNLWKEVSFLNDQAEIQLINKSKDGYGMLLYDGLFISQESMKEVLIINARNIDPDAKILKTEECIVNGIEGELVTYKAANAGLKFIFFAFIASQDGFTIQYTFFTLESKFKQLKPMFLDAISGLEIK